MRRDLVIRYELYVIGVKWENKSEAIKGLKSWNVGKPAGRSEVRGQRIDCGFRNADCGMFLLSKD
jgi:hypothetical protein